GGVVPLGYDVCERRIVIDEREAETVRYISGDTWNSAVFGCSKKIWTAAVSFPNGGPQRPVSSLAATRSPEEHFTGSFRILSTSVRSDTRTCAIQASIGRSWSERCGSEPSSSFRSTEFAPSATMQASSRRVRSSGDWSTRMAMGLRPLTHAKERESTAITFRATSRPKDLRRRASAGGCLPENSRIESGLPSGKCSMTSLLFSKPHRRPPTNLAESNGYSTQHATGVAYFSQKPNKPLRLPRWSIGWSSNLTE